MPPAPAELPDNIWSFVSMSISPIELQIREVRAAIQELASGVISQERIETLKYEVASQSEQLLEMEARLNRLEKLIWLQLLSGWTIIVALLTYYLINLQS